MGMRRRLPTRPLRWLRAAAAAAARKTAAARIRPDSTAAAVHRRHHCYRRISRGSIVPYTVYSWLWISSEVGRQQKSNPKSTVLYLVQSSMYFLPCGCCSPSLLHSEEEDFPKHEKFLFLPKSLPFFLPSFLPHHVT